MRLLLIEDDESVRLLVTHALGDSHVEVVVAATTREARERLEEGPVDAVVLDLVLPDGDGREMLAELRGQPRTAGVPVVILSGKGGRAMQLECFRLGADEFFEKPFDPEILAAALTRQLERVDAARAESRIDAVTGLPNRASLEERFASVAAFAEERDQSLTLAHLEVDGAEELHDRFGQDGLDRVLREVSDTLGRGTRATDIVGRWKGSEFLIFLPGSRLGPARRVIERILEDVRTRTIHLESSWRFASEATADTSALPSTDSPDATDGTDASDRSGPRNEQPDDDVDTPLLEGERIDPNRAGSSELARLPQIGPALAERMVVERDHTGPFLDAEDLLRVRGIGPAALDEIRPFLDLTPPPTATVVHSRTRTRGAEKPSDTSTEVRATFSAGLADARQYASLVDAVLAAEGALLRSGTSGAARVAAPDDEEESAPSVVHVLLVDDDEAIAVLVRHRLEREGFQVKHVADGTDALALIERDHLADFDLVLLDVKLPGVGGFELLGRLRERRSPHRVPAVMLTSMGNESDVLRAFELGADDYVVKPFSPVELLARLHRLLRSA